MTVKFAPYEIPLANDAEFDMRVETRIDDRGNLLLVEIIAAEKGGSSIEGFSLLLDSGNVRDLLQVLEDTPCPPTQSVAQQSLVELDDLEIA